MDKFSYINIREYLVPENPYGIGEADLRTAISDFSCPRNLDVENFLKKSAVEFTKKNQSVKITKALISCNFKFYSIGEQILMIIIKFAPQYNAI